MITGIVTHSGGIGLARHLTNSAMNERVSITRVQGIPQGSVEECLAALRHMAIGCRTTQPLAHAHASPSRTYSEKEWERYWAEFERVFDFELQPFVEVQHWKISASRIAPHRHRIYLRVWPSRKAISLGNSFLRSERVSRWAEYSNGEALTKGHFNRAIARAFRAEGRHEIADAMEKVGLLDGAVPIATRPHERQMTEAAGDISKDEAARRIWRCWTRSDNGPAFEQALREAGFLLARGTSVVVAVTARGVIHPLRRALRIGATEARAAPVRASDLNARLAGLDFADVPTVKAMAFASTSEVLGAYQTTGAERTRRTTTRPSALLNAGPVPDRYDRRPTMRGAMIVQTRPNEMRRALSQRDAKRLSRAARPPARADRSTSLQAKPEAPRLAERRATPSPLLSTASVKAPGARPMAAGSGLAVRRPSQNAAPRDLDARSSIAARQRAPAAPRVSDAAVTASGRWQGLTPAQDAAVDRFLATLEGGAAVEVAAMRQEAEEAAEQRAMERLRAEAHGARLAAARGSSRELDADLSRPSIGVPGWKDAYKAGVAGLPSRLGAFILWVETSVAERKTVTLRSGEHIHLMVDRATGSEATRAVAEVMVAHAESRQWASVVFSGGTEFWRVEAARLATRHGLVVANPELAAIVDNEKVAMQAETILARWRSAREAISYEPDSNSLRAEFISTIQSLTANELWRSIASESERDLIDYDLLMLRVRESTLAGTGCSVSEFGAFMTGTWRHVPPPQVHQQVSDLLRLVTGGN